MERTIALYSDTGNGKTTQAGEYAKFILKSTGLTSRLYRADLGGVGPIEHLVDAKMIEVVDYDPETNDPWQWGTDAVEGKLGKSGNVGLHIFDSGTSICEALLSSCAKLSADGKDIGGRPAPKFSIASTTGGKALKIGSNVDSHYMTVQGFIKDLIWRSTWLAKEADVLWTFGLYRGEDQQSSLIYGPQLAGKALTSLMPKWFNYTFPLIKHVGSGIAPVHKLLMQSQLDQNGVGTYYANARYPIDATTPCPLDITPASLSEAIRLIEAAKAEAAASLKEN